MAVTIQILGKLSESWLQAILRCRKETLGDHEIGSLEIIDFDESPSSLRPESDLPAFTIVVSKQWTLSKIRNARAALAPHGFGFMDFSPDQCAELIQRGLSEIKLRALKMRTLKNFKEQNRRLSDLSENLELRVQERTRTIENSKNEVETRQKRMKSLIRLVTELSQVETMQELMVLLKREIRRLNLFGDPMLLVSDSNGQRTVHFFRGANIFSRVVGESLRGPFESILPTAMQAGLADTLERPVAKVLTIAIGGHQNLTEHWIILENIRAGEEVGAHPILPPQTLNAMGTVLDRLAARTRIRFESKYWEKTFDAINDPVAIVDLDYHTLRFNQAFEAMNLSGGDLPGFCFRIFANADAVCPGCPKKVSQETGKSSHGEVRMRSRIFEVSSYPIQIGDSLSTTNFVNHYSDVTEHRQLLGRIVQNEKMTAIGLMAGSLAHELNNPLTGLSMMSQLLIKDPSVPEKVKEDLQEIERAAVRCQTTVRNLLKFTNLELMEEDIVETSWKDIVDQTLPLLKMAMRYLNYDNETSDTVGLIKVNSHLMGQVVFNLINNACQAMKQDGTLTIQTESQPGWSTLVIQDTGIGMSQENVDRIFEPFFTTKEKGVGTGIGLSLAQSIVQRFGGRIEVKSELGVGSTFRVSLPRVSS
ncbi:MAG: hypothetical protein K2X47_08800 [Bdellovibrionales bacterium]|nr:hypothetical protein [Bdellovibrionales bacterium]